MYGSLAVAAPALALENLGVVITVAALAAEGGIGPGHVQPAWEILVTPGRTAVVSTFTVPFSVGMTVLIYLDLRMRKENLHLAIQEATGTAPVAPPVQPHWS